MSGQSSVLALFYYTTGKSTAIKVVLAMDSMHQKLAGLPENRECLLCPRPRLFPYLSLCRFPLFLIFVSHDLWLIPEFDPPHVLLNSDACMLSRALDHQAEVALLYLMV